MSCEQCTDPDGVPCFPVYGLGPQAHSPSGTLFHFIPCPGYTPNPEEFGFGWYWCPKCEDGKPKGEVK